MPNERKGKCFTHLERVFRRAALAAALLGAALRAVAGMRFSSTLCLCGAAVLAVLALLERGARKCRGARWARNGLLALLALGFALFAVMEGMVLSGARADADEENVQAILVLGAGVNGETPSLTLRTRIDAAAAYIAAHPTLPIVLSGGQGPGEDITEAECMRRALVARGIADERLYLEERSTSTAENLAYSRELLDTLGFVPWSGETPAGGRVAVVTNDFHLCRTRQLAQPEMVVVGVPAALPWLHLTVNYYVREAFALAEMLVFGGML